MTESKLQNRLGYARVGSCGQMLDVQLGELKAAGCNKVYREKASGAQADRREFQPMLNPPAPAL